MSLDINVKYHESQDSELKRGSELAAGYDIAINDTVNLAPKQSKLICTGTAIAVPEGYYAELVPRSSSGKLKYKLANTIGIIDADYRDYIKVFIENTGNDQFVAYPGDYLFQLIFKKFEEAKLNKVKVLSKTVRGTGGFGSTTGKKAVKK